MSSLINRTEAYAIAIVLLVLMITMVFLGRWFSTRWGNDEGEKKGGVSALLAATYSLSGFILAFTFNMSGTRLERVRVVFEKEANEIGTAILRSDLYADTTRDGFRADLRDYLEAVIDFYDNVANRDRLLQAKEDAANAERRLWARATRQSKLPNMLIPSNQMLPALNEMFDIATTREIVLKAWVPDMIIFMLFVCMLSTCFIAGFTSVAFSRRDRIIITGFALISSLVVYTTIDLSRPMRGLIQEKSARTAIVELRKMFDQGH